MVTKNITKKICLLGDPAVGKTSLIHRYVYDVFDDKYLSTIGAKITKKTLTIDKTEESINLTMLVWDIAGQKVFGNVHQTYYRGAEGALLVTDITRKETFENAAGWVSELFRIAGRIPVIMLINKFDLKDHAAVNQEYVNKIAGRLGVPYLFTSAKSGLNVETAFKSIAENLIT